MKEPKFTPGPWEYDALGWFVYRAGDQSSRIADMRGWGWLQKRGEKAAIAEQNATGRFIATAPDLYEALEEMVKATKNWNVAVEEIIGKQHEFPMDLKRAEAALAKARGEE